MKKYTIIIWWAIDAELEKIIEMEASTIASDDYIAILLHKMRVRVATITLFNRQDSKTKELEQLFILFL